jgi:hypothetical protein
MKKIILTNLFALMFLYSTLSYLNKDINKQDLKSEGVWVGYETLIPIIYTKSYFLFQDFKYLYLKSDFNFIDVDYKYLKNRNIYYWYEDGLSLNYLTEYTEHLVFDEKIDDKYWLDIRKPEARKYIINKLKNRGGVKIHLDDHWAIPKQYGLEYTKLLNDLTIELVKEVGPISISVLPLNYARSNYNVDWQYWLDNQLLSEIILQNYSVNNFDYEILQFKNNVKYFEGNKGIGIYLREDTNTDIYRQKAKKEGFKLYIFSLRTYLFHDN